MIKKFFDQLSYEDLLKGQHAYSEFADSKVPVNPKFDFQDGHSHSCTIFFTSLCKIIQAGNKNLAQFSIISYSKARAKGQFETLKPKTINFGGVQQISGSP